MLLQYINTQAHTKHKMSSSFKRFRKFFDTVGSDQTVSTYIPCKFKCVSILVLLT